MVWTDSQDYGADEILYTTRIVLFNKINRLMREITILFGVSPQLFSPVVPVDGRLRLVGRTDSADKLRPAGQHKRCT